MHKILYIMVNRQGKIKTFSFQIPEVPENGEIPYDRYAPEQLRGYAQQRLCRLTKQGYNPSNWHLIEVE